MMEMSGAGVAVNQLIVSCQIYFHQVHCLIRCIKLGVNTLGQASILDRHSPYPIEALRKYPPMVNVIAGLKFAAALNGKSLEFKSFCSERRFILLGQGRIWSFRRWSF